MLWTRHEPKNRASKQTGGPNGEGNNNKESDENKNQQPPKRARKPRRRSPSPEPQYSRPAKRKSSRRFYQYLHFEKMVEEALRNEQRARDQGLRGGKRSNPSEDFAKELEVLGISLSPDDELTYDVIKTAYYKKARDVHPDKQPAHLRAEATARFQKLHDAYEKLTNIYGPR